MRQKATIKGARAYMLFIAELNGFKSGTVSEKEAFGKECYLKGTLHKLDLSSEDDRKELHENIWLERIYNELDAFYCNTGIFSNLTKRKALEGSYDSYFDTTADDHYWSTPIELDASASMLQYIGILLNDHRLTDMTNVTGNVLSDPWKFDGIPRTQFKHAATPMLYGSSRGCHELWKDKGHAYTMDQVHAFTKELADGPLGLANAFKEFIINNCKPTEVMDLKVFNEQFTVECNRFRNVGDHTTNYDIYDTTNNTVSRIHHTTTRKEADLEQFRRYFVTGLIHNLDSQVADTVIGKTLAKYGWGMDLHDAFIINPEAADDVRNWYAEELDTIHTNRKQILADYFQSIGIGTEAQLAWERVQSMVHPLESFKCQPMALK